MLIQILPSCDYNFYNVYATSCPKTNIKDHLLAFGLAFLGLKEPKACATHRQVKTISTRKNYIRSANKGGEQFIGLLANLKLI